MAISSPQPLALDLALESSQAEAIVRSVVQQFEENFPARVRAYYLIGSYADGSAVALSDLDMILVFKVALDGDELQAALELSDKLAAASAIRLDVTPRGENAIEAMYAVIRVGLKCGSVLVYGQDIRDQMPLPSPEEYTKDVIAGALFFIARLHDMEIVETLPLTYPDTSSDAQDPFYGYARKRFVEWYPLGVGAGTKELVATVSRIATATVAVKTGAFVSVKREGIRRYQEYAGEPWGSFAAAMYKRCKIDWAYLIPDSQPEQQELSELCRKMLAFENQFCELVGVAKPKWDEDGPSRIQPNP